MWAAPDKALISADVAHKPISEGGSLVLQRHGVQLKLRSPRSSLTHRRWAPDPGFFPFANAFVRAAGQDGRIPRS